MITVNPINLRNLGSGNRINGQWRIVFRWQGSNAHDVEIVDYH